MPWSTLEELKNCCSVKVESLLDAAQDLMWRITVTAKSGAHAPIVVEKHELRDAVIEAVRRARELGISGS